MMTNILISILRDWGLVVLSAFVISVITYLFNKFFPRCRHEWKTYTTTKVCTKCGKINWVKPENES